MRAVYAAKQIASEPDTPQSLRLKELVRVVRDASRPKPERGNAFLEFWKLALYPGADFVRVCARYGVQDWISDNTLADWTYSSATPLDEDRWPSANNSIFAVFAPASVQNQRNSIDVCFSLRGKIRGEELATDLREVYLDKAKILHAVIDPNRGFGDEPLYP